MSRDDRDHPVDSVAADRGGDVGAGDPDALLLVEPHRLGERQLAQCLAVAEVDSTLHREPGHRAVHRPRVEIAEAEPLGDRACDRALAGARRPVDGDDHRFRRESTSS